MGLLGKTSLNGHQGTLTTYLVSKGRWGVVVDFQVDHDQKGSRPGVLARTQNLKRPVTPPTSPTVTAPPDVSSSTNPGRPGGNPRRTSEAEMGGQISSATGEEERGGGG